MKKLWRHLKNIGLVIQIAPFQWQFWVGKFETGCLGFALGPITLEVWYA